MSWTNLEENIERGPMSAFKAIFLLIIAVSVIGGTVGYVGGWFSESANVVKQEFGPKAALSKYEWFINTANDVEKMDRDVVLFNNRLSSVEKRYQRYGENMADWPPHIQVQFNGEQQEAEADLLAVKSQRNGLVREYNAASEKFNWELFKTNPNKPKERFHEML